ncbi:MAG: hypothetical protein Fur0021_14760 [Candidatus Promineifilaceae bacterium]
MTKENTPKQRISQRQQRQEQVQRQKKNRLLRVWLPVGLLAIALTAFAIYQFTRPDFEGVIDLGTQQRGHDVDVSYVGEPLPPAGGVHHPTWQNCGIYDQPVNTSNAIHALEHGAVWLAYHPDLPAAQVTALQDLVAGKGYVLMSPYPGLNGQVVMTAWGKRLVLDTVAEDRIDDFINRYRGGGPEPGASCSGGVGTPIRS